MAKYRKKPIVVEAEQFFLEATPWPRGVVRRPTVDGSNDHVIITLEGAMAVSEGDWIITGVKGEKYPCKPDIFAATYDLVE